jgi:hypothetical protein
MSTFPIKINTPRGAYLICGEPGTGKSSWICREAQIKKAKLFRWNARIDRSLREGREILHQQVRSREKLFVWIEGADDLTQEAQAFLRRILETASENVSCMLEVREPWKLAPPILSRCILVSMNTSTSFRQAKHLELAKKLHLLPPTPPTISLEWKEISSMRKKGISPHHVLDACIEKYTWKNVDLQKCIRAIGNGSSPWVQLSLFLHAVSMENRTTPE